VVTTAAIHLRLEGVSTLDRWTAAVCADLGLDDLDLDPAQVLDLARDVAHGVARPAAPLTAYLVGVAVGRGLDVSVAAERVQRRARGWAAPEPGPPPGAPPGPLTPPGPPTAAGTAETGESRLPDSYVTAVAARSAAVLPYTRRYD
jgi:hypothetical protein